jgi:peptidoglycan/LPS O-acetylase OafA/YrhL
LSERRHELDWLRVLAVLLLIFFHSARVFDLGNFYVKNGTLSFGMEAFVTFIDLWFMPLFFFIAGASAFFALAKRSGKQFLSERTKRLLFPFVFGLLVIVPPQIFTVYLQKPGNPASYLSFWKYQFSVPPFTQIIAGKVNDALITAYTWETGHLWFIQYLFVFCLVTLPLLLAIRKGRLSGTSERLAAFCDAHGWAIYLFAVPVMLGSIAIVGLREDVGRLFLVIPFILGFLLYSNPGFGSAIDRNRRIALALALVTTTVFGVLAAATKPDFDKAPLFWGPVLGIQTWLWLLAFLGLGRKHLNFKNRFLKYANEGSYPFYILHQTVIVLLALGIIKIAVAWPVKYLLLVAASLVITAGTYDLLVRRWRPLRFLFGMRPKARPSVAEHPVPAAAQ